MKKPGGLGVGKSVCVDYYKIHHIHMPQIDKLLDQLGAAHFYLAKDLNKVEDFLDSDNLEKIT